MSNIQSRLKKLKYRCQTLGIKELDATFSKIFQKVESTQNIDHISLLEELVQNETQQILDIFFHPEAKVLRFKYQLIINLSK